MKNSKEIAETVFKIRDDYLEKQREKNRKIKKAISVCSMVCMFSIIIAGINDFYMSRLKPPSVDQSDISSSSTSDTHDLEKNSETSGDHKENLAFTETHHTDMPVYTTNDSATEKINDHSESNPDEIPSSIDARADHPMNQDKTTTPIIPYTDPLEEYPPIESESSDKVTASTIPSTDPPEESSSTDSEIVTEPKWNEKTLSLQFPEFMLDDITYITKDTEILSDYIYIKSTELTLTGYDLYTENQYSITADIYQINDISEKCAVAVQFHGYQNYYVYLSRSYYPQTLGELIDDLNLENTISFGDMYLHSDSSIKACDQDILKSLLTESKNCPCIFNDTVYEKKISFGTSIKLLGINDKSMALTEDGYLTTNIMEWGYAFYIGEDKVNAVYEALTNSAVDSDTAVPSYTEDMVLE